MDLTTSFDTLVFTNQGSGSLTADALSNILIGGDGDDLLRGRGDNDLIIGGGFSDGANLDVDLFNGTATFAPLIIDGPDTDGQDTLIGGNGDDTLIGGSWRDGEALDDGLVQVEETRTAGDGDIFITIFPHPFANEIWGGRGADLIFGANFGDTIGGGGGADTILAGTSSDLIFGGRGNDSIIAGDGNDRIWAGFGSDTITGGAGADIFSFSAGQGQDLITDFDVTEDRLDLSNIEGLASRDDLIANAAAQVDGGETPFDGVVVDLGDNASLALEGVTLDDLANIQVDL